MLIVGAWFGCFQAIMPMIGYFLGIQFAKFVMINRPNFHPPDTKNRQKSARAPPLFATEGQRYEKRAARSSGSLLKYKFVVSAMQRRFGPLPHEDRLSSLWDENLESFPLFLSVLHGKTRKRAGKPRNRRRDLRFDAGALTTKLWHRRATFTALMRTSWLRS